jgi:hypothetical protein
MQEDKAFLWDAVDEFVLMGDGRQTWKSGFVIGSPADGIEAAREVTLVSSETRGEFARVFTETIWKEFDVLSSARGNDSRHLSKCTA